MWLDELHVWRAATWADNHVVTDDKLVNVVIDTFFAEAFATPAALSSLQHDIVAQEAVEKRVMLSVRCFVSWGTHSSLDLIFVERHLALHHEWSMTCLAFSRCSWDKSWHFDCILVDRRVVRPFLTIRVGMHAKRIVVL